MKIAIKKGIFLVTKSHSSRNYIKLVFQLKMIFINTIINIFSSSHELLVALPLDSRGFFFKSDFFRKFYIIIHKTFLKIQVWQQYRFRLFLFITME